MQQLHNRPVPKLTAPSPTSLMSLGISDIDDFATNQFLLDAYNNSRSVELDYTQWVHDNLDQCRGWIQAAFSDFLVISSSRYCVVVRMPDSIIRVYLSATSVTISVLGSKTGIALVRGRLASSPFRETRSTVKWVHDEEGSTIEIPIFERPLVEGAYPWIEGGVDEYIDRFLESDETILILIGPPGTGKTSFIRHMINRSNGSALVTYDEKIMGSDSLFADWLQGSERFMCLEDSDAFLSARSDGNRMMHKFLNVSEGLVTVKGKKMIFSTNLPKVTDIDEALTRPGRCFDVLEFRELTYQEAMGVRNRYQLNIALEEGNTYSLASLFAGNQRKTHKPKRSFGFGFAG